MHVMLDIETLGTEADCVVMSVGAIQFNPKTFEAEERFYARLDLDEQLTAGRTVTQDTVLWWFKQDAAARKALDGPRITVDELNTQLAALTRDAAGVWGNGADFDNAIISHLLGRAPWKYWANRCFRTFTNLFDPHKELRVNKNSHNALDDCWNQLLWMAAISRAHNVDIK